MTVHYQPPGDWPPPHSPTPETLTPAPRFGDFGDLPLIVLGVGALGVFLFWSLRK